MLKANKVPFIKLRKRAEEILTERTGNGGKPSGIDLMESIHEIEVNQVELELQNEELLRARKELEDSRNRFYDLYNSAPVGFVTLSPKKLIVRINRTAKEMLAPLGIVGHGEAFSNWIDPRDYPQYHACLKKVLEGGGRHACEVRLTGRYGSIYARIEAAAGLDEKQKPVEFRLALTDITDLKKTEEALRKAQDRLEEKVRKRTKELVENYERLSRANSQLQVRADQLRRLASELTTAEQRERQHLSKTLHDGLQQHLATAKLRIGYFADKLRDKARKQEAYEIEAILGESMQMSRSLSVELSPPVLHAAGLAEGLEWLARWMRDKHNFNVELTVDDEPELPQDVTILVFESVRELLFNAVKHAKVSWARVQLEQNENSEIRIVVSDEGVGFDPALLESTESAEGGLGLFSIRERIDSIGGRFEIESAPGRGCRFTLMLPNTLASAQDLPGASANGRADACADTRETPCIRVLLADDHALFRDGISRILSQEPDMRVVGYAKDGREAIELARKLSPDIILMDIGMPKVDGIEATRTISRESAGIRIIGLSMYEDKDRSRAMLSAGAVGYKSKGCAPAELIAAIRSYLK